MATEYEKLLEKVVRAMCEAGGVLEMDPDCDFPGLSFAADSAVIIKECRPTGKQLKRARKAILSLLDRVERAEAQDRVGVMLAINEIRWAIGDNGRAMLADLPNAVRAEIVEANQRGYQRGLEEAAKWVESSWGTAGPRIAKGIRYLAKEG